MTKFYLYLSRYLTVLFLMISTLVFSQNRTVTGRVLDPTDGSGLPGVNILEKNSQNGTITSADGSFSLEVGNDAILVFSFVGYKTLEVPVGSQNQLTVNLESDVTALSEVVVIGYGTVQKRDAIGAIASVKAEDFNVGVIASPEQLIQGKTAGVQITSASGEPGAGANIRIRGTSSVRGGNNPLFVVDGIPLSNADVSAGGTDVGRGTSTARNPLNFLNPNDIESIDILKDASATAIYGSRGANGVVLITTKSGKGRKHQVEYGTTLNVSRLANRFDLLDRNQFLTNAASLGGDLAELDQGGDTDWQDEISRTAISHRHDLSFANNYKNGNYRASLSYDNQQGVIKNSALERITGRLNVNHSFLQDKLKVGAQLTLSRVNDTAAPITENAGFEGDLLGATYMANPTWQADPTIQFSNTNVNPRSLLEYTQDETATNRALLNFSAGYDITKELNFKINTGFDIAESTRENAFSPLLFANNGVFENGRAAIVDLDNDSELLEAFFNYNKKLGENSSLSAVLGYSYQQFNRVGRTVLGWGFADGNMDRMISDLHASASSLRGAITFPYQQFGSYRTFNDRAQRFWASSLQPTPTITDLNYFNVPVSSVAGDSFNETDELQSFFGRIKYSLKDRYLFEGTLRADGSTRFGGNNKYGYFPSAAFAWRLSEEEFVPELFDDLKLRLGYGVTGNQEIPHNRHQARQRYSQVGGLPESSPLSIGNDGNIPVPPLRNVSFQNPDLQWEQTSQLNLGLDFGFANGKFGGTIDVYRKVTTDILFQLFSAQPAPQDFNFVNLDADIINSGIELTLNYYPIEKEDIGLGFNFNISYNKNVVENFDGIVDTGGVNGQGLSGAFAQRIVEGQSLFTYFLREFGGFNSEGLAVYEGGDIPRYVGKSPLPDYNLGFNTNFRYKNWDLNLFLTGQFGHYVYNNTANAFFSLGSLSTGKNVTTDVLGTGESAANAPDASTRFLEKGDYLRMQNLNLGYNFTMAENSFIKKLRIYTSAQNLFVITNYSGLDPEVNTNKQIRDVPSFGIDYTSYPRARTFTLGLNATF